jgi:hypothetical protein
MKINAIMLSAAAMMVAPSTANAATLIASYFPANNAGSAFSFMVDDRPVPNQVDQFGFTTTIRNATGSLSNSSDIRFFFQSYFGGISGFSGPQIFAGPASSPTILVGEHIIFGAFNNTGILTVSVSSAVPESSTWITLLVGFGMAGITLRYRRYTTKITCA